MRFEVIRAIWRAAMRGKVMSSSDDVMYQLLSQIPAGADRAIVIYPVGDAQEKTAVAWIGMSEEQVAETLYSTADNVVAQRLPIPDWIARGLKQLRFRR